MLNHQLFDFIDCLVIYTKRVTDRRVEKINGFKLYL